MQYTFSLSRRSLPVRCLCLFLIVIVLLCFFLTPRAGAVALEVAATAYSAALVGAILVGAGVVFASHGDMQAVGAAMVKSWQQSNAAIGSKISALASWAVQHGEAAAKGALRVGKDLYQAVVDAFNASYSDGVFSITGQDFYVSSSSAVPAFAESFTALRATGFTGTLSDGTKVDGRIIVEESSGGLIFRYKFYKNGRIIAENYYGPYVYSRPRQFFFYFDGSTNNWAWLKLARIDSDGTVVFEAGSIDIWRDVPFSISSVGGITIPSSDLAYPSDDYLVKMPDIPSVDTETGEAAFPADAAYTKDSIAVPYPVDADGVKVPDIPYDKVVDQSTGKTLDDTDTGTDTDKPGTDTDKPGTDTETGGLLGQIIALLKNFFDSPSDFKLDFDGFKNLILPERFPFCIPFDMVKAVKLFAAAAADFAFSIDLDTQYFAVHHTVDLTPYVLPIAFFRYGCVIWFVWILISRTHDLIKW